MPIVSDPSFHLAIQNVVHFGDTDVFPFPLENHWFAEDADGVITLLRAFDDDFDGVLARYPVTCERTLAGVGYNGFRAATQIDPLWNLYLLALCLEIGVDLEAARVNATQGIAFSYRYTPNPSTGALFDRTQGWRAFQEKALEHATEATYVLATDISDFYPRIYHHRLDNALRLASSNREAVRRIVQLLFKLSDGVSYGLPIGGNAARLLAELLLNRVDRLLLTHSIKFCRFVDDYLIFASSREAAQRALVVLSDALLRNEGLTLSRAKSRLMSSAEFRRSSPIAKPEQADSAEESQARRFLRIRWSYDPYSPNASDEYDQLVDEVAKFDVLSMLAGEFRKTRIDESLVRQLIRSITFLDPDVRDRAIVSLVDNLHTLYPVFPTVAILLRRLLDDVSPEAKSHIFGHLRGLIRSESHIMMVPTNALFAVRLLAHDPSEEVEVLLANLYRSPAAEHLLRRDIVYAMARRGAHYWVSDLMKRHAQVSSWELRALLAASYALGDEGRHWRRARERELSDVDRAYLLWLGRKNDGSVWALPI